MNLFKEKSARSAAASDGKAAAGTQSKQKFRDQMDPEQISKDLLRETLTGPVFVYSLAGSVSLAAMAAAIGFDGAGWYVLGTGIVLGAAAGLWAVISQGFLRDRRMYQRMVRLRERMADEIKDRKERLMQGVEDHSDERSARQLQDLISKFDLVQRTLGQRFDTGEMTYVRYLGTAEQVYLGAFDNLETILESRDALESTDRKALDRQLKEAERAGQERVVASTRQRIEIHDRAQGRIETLYAANEEAVMRLEQVQEALIGLNTGQGLASAPLEQAMEELHRLAARTAEYGR